MKFNKWTVGLAAVGVVSLASAARADEKMNSLQTALSNTTISGYVSASFNYAITPGGGKNQFSPAELIPFQGQRNSFSEGAQAPTKQDGFNLDVVKLTIAKPEDESPWASGYQVDLIFGPDAVGYNTSANAIENNGNVGQSSDFAIKQAYVTLRTPVGNGIDWKIGVFDTIIGYEVFDAGSNPNYTRSWGYAIEPTEHTGILASYKLNDMFSFSAGLANTLSAGINARDGESGFANNSNNKPDGAGSFWHKTVMGSATFTAPSSWGWAAGSSIYAGAVYGFTSSTHGYANDYQLNWYGGATMNTPWKQLTAGIAFDYAEHYLAAPVNVWSLGVYATYKATDKLSFSGRAEYVEGDAVNSSSNFNPDLMELTATVEYDLWANVVSRVELRYDHVLDDLNSVGDALGSDIAFRTSVGLYANIIYKF
ncbi:MAG TPA: outer membrane beta-barrel protein [Verrucomicrobiae bacterium]